MVLRIGYEPRIAGDAVGTTPIFNWLLWGYGIPAASFWIGKHLPAPPRRRRAAAHRWKSAAILFTVLLVFMEIRHAVYGGDVYRVTPTLAEFALRSLLGARHGDRARAAAAAHQQHRARHRRGAAHGVCRRSSACSGCCCWRTRILTTIELDGGFINLLLLAYALPAVLMLLLSYAAVGRRGAPYANTIAAGALIFALAYVTLEIRRLYQGPVINVGNDQRRRAIYLFDRLAGLRRGAARHRHPRQLAARPAGIGGRDRADDRQGVPGRHVDADGRLPRAVVHLPRPGAGRDRLAVPAHPVPETGRRHRRPVPSQPA